MVEVRLGDRRPGVNVLFSSVCIPKNLFEEPLPGALLIRRYCKSDKAQL